MITQIRTFFDDKIKDIDSTLNAWDKDLFGNNDLNKSQADKFYNLIIGASTIEKDGQGLSITTSVQLDIYSSFKRDLVTNFDELYDKAYQIMDNIVHPQSYTGLFSDVTASSIEPVEENTNDNSIKMRLQFSLRKDCRFN
jgi:hypothetical protein